jgi:dUTP pyrophosphatase
MPKYQTDDASGINLHAYLVDAVTGERTGSVAVSFGKTTKIRTGIRVGIPPGHEGQIRGRSGRAFYNGVFAYNGTIDQGFTGEIMALLTCHRDGDVFHVKHGDRIAQLVIAPVARCDIECVENLNETARGDKGFGSAGG